MPEVVVGLLDQSVLVVLQYYQLVLAMWFSAPWAAMKKKEFRRQVDERLELCVGKVSRSSVGIKEIVNQVNPGLSGDGLGSPGYRRRVQVGDQL